MVDQDDRTLDVAEPQILLHFGADPNGLTEHHRLLLCRLSAGRWVAATPDFDLEVIDLNHSRHTVLRRRSLFPVHLAAAVYAFDPVSRNDLENLRREAKIMATVLGDEGPFEEEARVWVFFGPRLFKARTSCGTGHCEPGGHAWCQRPGGG